MASYSDMQARIQDELKRPDLSAQIRLAIKSAINYYEDKRFWFNEARAYRNTVDGQEYYGLPDDFLQADIIPLTTTGYTYEMIPRTYQYLERVQGNDNWKSRPTDWALYDKQLRLYPIPNDTYRVDISYVKQLEDVSATGSENAWMNEGEELIRMHAKIDVMMNVIRGDALKEAAFLRPYEDSVLGRLLSQSTSRRTTGRIRPSRY